MDELPEIETPWGARLWIDPSDQSHPPKLFETGLAWRAEVGFLRSVVRPGWTVIDVGAHFGYLASLFAASVGPAGHVVAVEPDPRLYRLLERNLRSRYEARVTLVPSAVAAKSGVAKLWIDETHFRCNSLVAANTFNPARPIDVQTLTLDDLCETATPEGRIDLLKIDTEGTEGDVLRGGDNVLDRVDRIWFEFWPDGLEQAGTDPRELLDGLVEHGFRLGYMDLVAKGPLTMAAPDDIVRLCAALEATHTEEDEAAGLYALVYVFSTRLS